MKTSYEKVLRDFLLDINCLKRLDEWTDEFNLFEVLKITNMEIRHSNILAWLFDPNENHGLGDAFIKGFITSVIAKHEVENDDAFNILLQSFYSYQVYREANHMDIVLYSHDEKTVVIIENKIWAGESSHQLKDYMEKSKMEYSDCMNFLYVFLTPDGRDASDPDNWVSFSYNDIVEVLEDAVKGTNLRPEVNLVINNYIQTVRKKIMKEKDERLVRVCNEIYNKHRAALKLIFENVSIDNSVETEIICDELKKLDESGNIIYPENNKWMFFTKSMNDFLPALEMENSSWGTDWVYYYWFEKSDEKLIIHFEIGGWNLPDETKKHQEMLISTVGKKTKEYKYCRLFLKAVKISEDCYEENLRKAVTTLVKAALKFEEDTLKKVQEKPE